METLTSAQAHQIVKQLMECIPYNINIMDAQGKIIASGNQKRIGTVHQGALKAIQTQSIIIVEQDNLSEKKGTNEPIFFDGKIVGVVGITGEPKQVSLFTKLVRVIVVMLLEEFKEYQEKKKAEQNRKKFIENLLQHEKLDDVFLVHANKFYNLDLSQPKIIVFSMHSKCFQKEKNFNSFPFKKGNVTFIDEESEIDYPKQLCVFSQKATNYSEMLEHVWRTYLFAQFLNEKETLVYTQEYDLFNRIFSSQFSINHKLYRKVEQIYDDSKETLVTFFKNNLEMNFTADQLYIHRNTLRYRLNKINQITDKNPFVVSELFELIIYYALIYFKREEV